jgi:hypothetical protein
MTDAVNEARQRVMEEFETVVRLSRERTGRACIPSAMINVDALIEKVRAEERARDRRPTQARIADACRLLRGSGEAGQAIRSALHLLEP